MKEARVVVHFERAYWVKCTTLLCSSLMQCSSGDKTSRWEISEPERTCWLTATLDTLARAQTHGRTHTKKSFSVDASHLQTLWFHWTEIKMTPGAKIYGTYWLKTDNLLFRRKLWVTLSFKRKITIDLCPPNFSEVCVISSFSCLSLFRRRLSSLCGGNGAAVETQRFNVSDRIRVEALPCSKTHSEEAVLCSHTNFKWWD